MFAEIGGHFFEVASDQALPPLRAFNQQFSQQGQGLAGALENLLSKNRGSGQSSSAGQQITNVLASLGSLVTTNAQGGTAVNPERLRNLDHPGKGSRPGAAAAAKLNADRNESVTFKRRNLKPQGALAELFDLVAQGAFIF